MVPVIDTIFGNGWLTTAAPGLAVATDHVEHPGD
jgi:hypothetical protein